MDTVCFHAQQCVEKYLKAVLVLHATPFPKTHDLSVLVALLPTKFRPQLDRKDQKLLTDYATVRRYPDPGGGPEISVTEARKAVALARSRSSRAAKAGLRMRFWPSVHPGENSTSLNRADAHRGARLAQYRGHRIGSALPIVRPASGHPSSQLCPISFARRITEGVQQTSYRCGASN
ncbi:MAG TPA: HEPN domain-containing protein [Pirellulales bacterium]|nr:HEPN domain-containing protein [Pirellulales bacterium]